MAFRFFLRIHRNKRRMRIRRALWAALQWRISASFFLGAALLAGSVVASPPDAERPASTDEVTCTADATQGKLRTGPSPADRFHD